MATFSILGTSIELPARPVQPRARSDDQSAWLHGQYLTVCLTGAVTGIRVHTDGKTFPGRAASSAAGKWVALGDVIQTSRQFASTRALPTANPGGLTAFTHTGEALLAVGTVINVGLAAAKFGGAGGGLQAEYVSGPPITFVQFPGKRWHGRAGNA